MAIVREAGAADAPAVADFLARHLGHGRSELFRRIFDYRWLPEKPNLGFLIEHESQIRGFVGGIYCEREIRGQRHRFCNIHSFAVDPEFRKLSLPAMKRLLDQPGYSFTCFSASPGPLEILQFFKFHVVDATKVVFTPASGLTRLVTSGVRLYRGAALLERLGPSERAIVRDHAGYRCGHFLLEAHEGRCYFVTVRRGRDVRAFADVLYASNPGLLAACIAHAHVPVGLTHRTALIGLDRRFVPEPPAGSFLYGRVAPFTFRSTVLQLEDIDMLYSEFVPLYG
jgi:hypothetical protein